jgi:hypothetical protein
MSTQSLYRLTAACLIAHELELLLLRELDVFHGTATPFGQAMLCAHIAIVLGLLIAAEVTRNGLMRLGLCVFAVLHVGLHWLCRHDPDQSAASAISWVLILLAGVFGAAYLVPQKAR